jgi:hypothetical protein
VGDLERDPIRGCLSVQLAMMSHHKRSTNLLEDTSLARCVFRILVDRAGFVEVTPATSTILCLGSRFDQDLALDVVMLCELRCTSQEACWKATRSCEGV